MVQSGDVISLDEYRDSDRGNPKATRHRDSSALVASTGDQASTASNLTSTDEHYKIRPVAKALAEEVRGQRSETLARMTMDELYRGESVETLHLKTISKLLGNIYDQLTGAMAARQIDDLLAVDNYLIHVRKDIPELFYLSKDLGDGFAECIRAVNQASSHLIYEPPSLEQLEELRLIFRKLMQRPFVHMDNAVEWVTALEDAGMTIDSPIIGMIADAVIVDPTESDEKGIR